MTGNLQADTTIMCAIIGACVTLSSVWLTHYLAKKREAVAPSPSAKMIRTGTRIKRMIFFAGLAALIFWGGMEGLYTSMGGAGGAGEVTSGVLIWISFFGAVYQLLRLMPALWRFLRQ
jgi:hypothetical protein